MGCFLFLPGRARGPNARRHTPTHTIYYSALVGTLGVLGGFVAARGQACGVVYILEIIGGSVEAQEQACGVVATMGVLGSFVAARAQACGIMATLEIRLLLLLMFFRNVKHWLRLGFATLTLTVGTSTSTSAVSRFLMFIEYVKEHLARQPGFPWFV